MSDKVCETPVSIGDVQSFLLKSAGLKAGDSAISGHSAKRIGVGQGFLSHICQLKLTWTCAHDQLPETLVIKVPTLQYIKPLFDGMFKDEERDQMAESMEKVKLPMMHAKECSLYELFRSAGSPLPTPKIYYAQEFSASGPGILAMEDLSSGAGCATVNVFNGYRLEQVLSIAEALADLHAFSLDDADWVPQFPDPGKEEFEHSDKMMAGSMKALSQMDPVNFPEEKLDEVKFTGGIDYAMRVSKCYKDLGIPPVMVHGDLWCNNILFRPDATQKTGPEVVSVVDWQGAHAGTPVEDLLRILVSSCDADLRRRFGRTILHHYYDHLCAKLRSSAAPFTFTQLEEMYNYVFPWAFNMVAFGIPLMAGPASPMLAGDPDAETKRRGFLRRGGAALDDLIQLKREGKLWPHNHSTHGLRGKKIKSHAVPRPQKPTCDTSDVK